MNVKTLNPELMAPHGIPNAFKEAFLNGSIYDTVSIKMSDSPIKAYCSFDTEPEEEFDEYTHPRIYLMLAGKAH